MLVPVVSPRARKGQVHYRRTRKPRTASCRDAAAPQREPGLKSDLGRPCTIGCSAEVWSVGRTAGGRTRRGRRSRAPARRPWRPDLASASRLLTRSTTLKNRPRAPPRMQARAMPTAMCTRVSLTGVSAQLRHRDLVLDRAGLLLGELGRDQIADDALRLVLALHRGSNDRECPIFCVRGPRSMLREKDSVDHDEEDRRRASGRAAEGLRAA
jgi:hypothetical protein